MLCLSLLSTLLILISFPFITTAATVPPAATLISPNYKYPNINLTSARLLLDTLARIDTRFPNRPLPLHSTKNPWPPAPFEFPSPNYIPWTMRVRSYEPLGILTFRQIHAAVSLCVAAIDALIRDRQPLDRMDPKTYVFRTDTKHPYDLSREDVEVAIFNEADVPGHAYTARTMVTALNVLLDTLLPRDIEEMTGAIVHYSVLEPRIAGVGLREMRLRKKTRMQAEVVGTS
ncbi:MAG: hypothetical protein LQ350_007149 [Teloschistes chrysophthalmus]|nr:MAG: hypothetical protein LQ350_007149 [Niorma chrysophthalma]